MRQFIHWHINEHTDRQTKNLLAKPLYYYASDSQAQ